MTSFDVLGGVELTMSAAIVVVALIAALGRDTSQRMKLAAIVSGWFVIVVIMAATRVLQDGHGIGAPGMGLAVAAPIALMWLALVRLPSLREGMERAPLTVLVGLHAVRVLGVSFLVLQASNRLPAPFAPVAGWGDIVTGITAVPVAWVVYRQAIGWRAMLVAWNLFGLADLVAAIGLGVLSAPGPARVIFAEPGSGLMSALPWLLIPGFIVPLFVISHVAIFYRLSKSANRSAWPERRGETSVVGS